MIDSVNFKSNVSEIDSSSFLNYTLNDFFSEKKYLDKKVNEIFDRLTDEERIAQMIITSSERLGKSGAFVEDLIRKKGTGGVLLLGGSKEEFIELIKSFTQIADSSGSIPLIFSTDVEPSLINKKISGVKKFGPTNTIKNEKDCEIVANDISDILKNYKLTRRYIIPVWNKSM